MLCPYAYIFLGSYNNKNEHKILCSAFFHLISIDSKPFLHVLT